MPKDNSNNLEVAESILVNIFIIFKYFKNFVDLAGSEKIGIHNDERRKRCNSSGLPSTNNYLQNVIKDR